jgi:ABC-type Fe3+/spermidine/putrescine transport system ATPase subunit
MTARGVTQGEEAGSSGAATPQTARAVNGNRAAAAVGDRAPSGVSGVDLWHRYEGFEALKGVSLDVQPGEFLTLLGPSGSGKTTLLRIVAGLIHPTSGRVKVNAEDITELPARKRDIGLVFQNYALFPHLTVAENLAFPLKLRRIKGAELVELQQLGARYPEQLSGGQQQRVALARAIVFNPRLLLLDEPLGALDRRLRQQLGRELRRIQRETSLTTIYVTHDQEEAFTMSDRIAVMHQGTVRQVGTPAEVYSDPCELFVARFLGEINTIPGIVSHADDSTVGITTPAVGTLTSTRTGRFPTGRDVMCAVRPEDVKVGSAAATCRQGDAVVESVIFQGGRQLINLRAGSAAIVAERATEEGVIPEGDVVAFGWQPSNVLLLEPDEAMPAGDEADPDLSTALGLPESE